MIAKTYSKDEIKSFFDACQELASREAEDEEFVKNSQDGSLLAPYPSTEGCAGQLGFWGSAAVNRETTPTGYVTGSGKGTYFLSNEPDNSQGTVTALYFVGYRGSFKVGCGYLHWGPHKEAGWEIVDSTQAERGAFDA
jgi:hypothetical protein